MKRKMKILAVLLAGAMCAGILAACTSTTTVSGSKGSGKTDVTETDGTQESTQETATQTQAEPEQDVTGEAEEETGESESVLPKPDDSQEDEVIIAKVHEIAQEGTLILYLYDLKSGCEDYVITDYASVDFDNYVYRFNTMEYTIRDTVTVDVAKGGALYPASAADIGVDDMLVICHDEEGTECVTVYQSVLNAS